MNDDACGARGSRSGARRAEGEGHGREEGGVGGGRRRGRGRRGRGQTRPRIGGVRARARPSASFDSASMAVVAEGAGTCRSLEFTGTNNDANGATRTRGGARRTAPRATPRARARRLEDSNARAVDPPRARSATRAANPDTSADFLGTGTGSVRPTPVIARLDSLLDLARPSAIAHPRTVYNPPRASDARRGRLVSSLERRVRGIPRRVLRARSRTPSTARRALFSSVADPSAHARQHGSDAAGARLPPGMARTKGAREPPPRSSSRPRPSRPRPSRPRPSLPSHPVSRLTRPVRPNPVPPVPRPSRRSRSAFPDEPFVMPNESDLHAFREEERARALEERALAMRTSVRDKTTFTSRCVGRRGSARAPSANGAAADEDDDATGAAASTAKGPSAPAPTRRQPPETMTDFIAKKREIFLVQMALDTKHAEIVNSRLRATRCQRGSSGEVRAHARGGRRAFRRVSEGERS